LSVAFNNLFKLEKSTLLNKDQHNGESKIKISIIFLLLSNLKIENINNIKVLTNNERERVNTEMTTKK